jgi:hypothetical protein
MPVPAPVAEASTPLPEPTALVPRDEAPSEASQPSLAAFESPEAAMLAVAGAAESGDHAREVEIFGQGCHDMIDSGDDDADRDDCHRVAAMIREHLEFEDGAAGRKSAVIGKDRWRFPIPLAKSERGWGFDLDSGRDQLLSRAIGSNELFTANTLEEYIAAQNEYAAASPEGRPHSFAARIRSTAGKQDGLYWEGASGKPLVGPSLAAAAYDESRESGADPVPFHGYFYKALHGQGKAAPGGEVSYLGKDGRMTEGCGALAWPASHGETGVMTFMVNHAGIVYEKDLGPNTAEIAPTITVFAPDETWKPVQE